MVAMETIHVLTNVKPFWSKASDLPGHALPAHDGLSPVHVVLPFKDQNSTDIVCRLLKDLSQKICTTTQPLLVSHKT